MTKFTTKQKALIDNNEMIATELKTADKLFKKMVVTSGLAFIAAVIYVMTH